MVVVSPILLFQLNIFLSIHKTSRDTLHNMTGVLYTARQLEERISQGEPLSTALKPVIF
jgi:hypothetical protein